MRRLNTELILKNSLKFTQSCLKNCNLSTPISGTSLSNTEIEEFESLDTDDCFGGIIKKGQLGWLAKGPLFEVFSLKTGQKISSFRFDLNLGFQRCIVTCVSEIDVPELNFSILAICMQFGDLPGGVIVLCSVQELSKIFRCIEIKEKITSCHYIRKEITKRTVLQIFNGCLAVGTDNGNVILLDLDLEKCEEALFSSENDEEDIELVPCHVIENTSDFRHLTQHYQHSKQENMHFGIEINVSEESTFILSIITIVNILSLAIGLEDGNLIFFDLSEFQVSYVIPPPSSRKSLPLVKLTYLEPADDPRACIYLWAFHEGQEPSAAIMYSIMYEKRIIEDDGICLFEDFQSCSLRLTLNFSESGSIPIACQSIFKQAVNDDEITLSLCMLAWKQQNSTNFILFDMNQWYKEQMPDFGSIKEDNNYLASFVIKDYSPLDVYINPSTVASFNSIQRAEEHFYANSLSFECIILNTNGCSHYQWPGLQNRALEILKSGGALAILEPTPYFDEIIRASLMPQFFKRKYDYRRLSNHSQYSDDEIMNPSAILDNYNSVFSINDQRNILLSVALEYNCFGLLKECAISWADGSHLGKRPYEGLSLSTLTEWIWQRANAVKKRCNTLCIPLFDHSGLRVDQRSKTELLHLLRQLKSLSNLMEIILKKCRKYIPDDILDTLLNQYQSIRTASEYQEIVLWLLNIGLLPEGLPISDDIDDNLTKTWSQSNLVPYPYKILKNFYSSKRKSLGQVNKSSLCSRTGSCRILYIDAFIDHECNSTVLRDHWIECGGNGLYPPPSLQAMLRTMLVPDIPVENKYVLFIYLFLDLNMAVECETHAAIVQNLIKFPAVFKLNASLIKTVQAFWNLDHGQFEIALEELISPFSQDRKLLQWQKELVVEALLTQDQPNLALRALQISSTPILTLLELKTLLANDLVADAFHLQRTKNDPELFRKFLTGCLCLGKLGVLRDLAFTEEESRILEEFLKESESSKAENLHFVYLLQRSKYIDALSYLDELSHNKKQNHRRPIDLETPNLILSAFNSTMTPASKHLADVYYGIRNKIRPKDLDKIDPSPLSSDLFQNDANKLVGGVYHSSVLSADQATVYWDENVYRQRNRLFNTNNAAFVRSPQLDIPTEIGGCKDSVSYPEIYKNTQKRKLENGDSFDSDEDTQNLENPQKRRKISDINLFSKSRNQSQSLNTSLLTKFRDKSNQNDLSNVERVSTNSISRQNSIHKFSNVLNTPIVKSSRVDLRNEYDSTDDRIYTPQSILKGKNHSSRTPAREYVRRKLNIEGRKTTEEEKSIRFELPKRQNLSRQNSSSSVSSYSKNNDKIVEDEKQKVSNDFVEHSTTSEIKSELHSGPRKRKPLRRSETTLMSTSLESEDYYSVPTSKDVSRISENDINGKIEMDISLPLWGEVPKSLEENQLTVPQSEVGYESYRNEKNMNGPKPRRPLRSSKSVSSEDVQTVTSKTSLPIKSYQNRDRSRSKTPERSQLPSRKSERLQSKAKTIEIFDLVPPPAEPQEKELLRNSLRNQYKSLSQKVLEANAVKTVREKIGKETNISLPENVKGDTYVIDKSEINENSEFSFEPHSFTSTKILESSTPNVNEKRTLERKSLLEISDSYKETITFNVSAEYFSVSEKTEEEQEETVVNTMNTETATELTALTYCNLTKTICANESRIGEANFDKFSSPRDSEVNQENGRNMSIEYAEEENENLKDYPKENEKNFEIKNNEPTFSSPVKINNLCSNEDENSNDKISIHSSTTDSEKEDELFSVKSNKDFNMSKTQTNDDIVSISSDDTTGGFVDTKDYESSTLDEDEDKSESESENGEEEEEEKEDLEDNNISDSDNEKATTNLLYGDLDNGMGSMSEESNDENEMIGEIKEILPVSGKSEMLQLEDQNIAKIEANKEERTLNYLMNEEEDVKDRENKNEMLQEQISIDLERQQPVLFGNLEPLYNEIDIEMKSCVTDVEKECANNLQNTTTLIFNQETMIVENVDTSNKNVEILKELVEQPEECVSDKNSRENPDEKTPETKSVKQEDKNDSNDMEVEMLTEKNNELNNTKTVEKAEEFKIKETTESASNEGNTDEGNTGVNVTTNKHDQIGSAKKRKLISELQTDNFASFIYETPEKRVLRARRARSESIDIENNLALTKSRNSPVPSRLTRAKSVSVDTSPLTPNRILTRRRSALLNRINEDTILQSPSRSTTPDTPSRVLTRRQSALLDRIEENSVLNTPRKLLDTMDDNVIAQTSVTKRNQKISTIKDVPATPRSTRSRSILSEDNYETRNKNSDTPVFEETSYEISEKKKREERAKKVKAKKIESFDSDEEKEVTKVSQKENSSAKDITRKIKKEKSVEPENLKMTVKHDKEEHQEKEEGKVTKKKRAKSVEPENTKTTIKNVEKISKTNKSEESPETEPKEEVTPETKTMKTKKEKSVERGVKARGRLPTPKPSSSRDDESDTSSDTKDTTRRKRRESVDFTVSKKGETKYTKTNVDESNTSTEKDELDEIETKEMINSKKNKKSSKHSKDQELEEESMMDDYASSRRLTRRQQTVVRIKKTVPMASPQTVGQRKRSTRSEEKSILDSETESIDSTRSKRSSSKTENRRQTRSSVKDDNEETSSVSSSISTDKSKDKTGKSKKTKTKNLAVIHEEAQSENEDDAKEDNDSNQTPKKRGRPRRTKE